MTPRDRHGREIKEGDLLKVPHFTAARGRSVFMYKLVVRVDRDLRISKSGEYLYAVSVGDIAKRASLDRASKCPVFVLGVCEIIDGLDCFWERPKVRKAEAVIEGSVEEGDD